MHYPKKKQLGIVFIDGKSKTVDINPFIKKGVSDALRDPQYLKKNYPERIYYMGEWF